MFHCFTIWSGTTYQNIHKLQLVQNIAAGVLTGTGRKFEHISPVLIELGWLPVGKQLKARDATKVYKCLNNLAPSYFAEKLSKLVQVHQ